MLFVYTNLAQQIRKSKIFHATTQVDTSKQPIDSKNEIYM